jgi:hemolysin activation/secretion protein
MRELLFAELGYGRNWFDGLFWTEFGASISRSSGSGSFPDFTSESERYYGRILVPVVRTREHSLWAKLQFDARDVEVLDITAAEAREHTRVLRGSLSYTLIKGATRADINLEASRGIDALGASNNGDANLSRPDARPQFTKLRLDASLTRRLFAKLDLAAMGAGQWADGSLTAAEEFGVGGARYGRAYDYSEIVGDRAIAGALELRWTWKKLNDWLTSVQLYAFADAARIWNEGAPSGSADESLTSAGGGVRVGIAPGVNATVEVAKPLSRDVASQGDRTPRVFVSVAAGW